MKNYYLLLAIMVIVSLFPSVTHGQESKEGRSYWIDRYLSVSYPLASIEVTSTYGERNDPFTGQRNNHSGLDLRANYEQVMAMFDGTVERIGSDDRSGNFVILRHGEYTICYCHLSRVLVSVEDSVYAGVPVAVSGNTGRSTGPHLHITARRKGELVNPYTLLYIRNTREECVKALMPVTVVPRDKEAFFQQYSSVAMEHQRRYGIPASVTLAQMALESGYGESELARKGNNFFGIKVGSSWKGARSWHDDDVPGYFRNYDSVWESIDDHSRLLMTDRYRRCRNYGSTDFHGWLVEIKRAGYASAKDYVQSCENIITNYKLYIYDKLAQGETDYRQKSNGQLD
jgi:hypothetical protein